MSPDINDVEDQRLSRRTALKGLGAAGATAAWTVPTILSTSAASAATLVPHPCLAGDCGPDPCNDTAPCGTDSVTGGPCLCLQDPLTAACACAQVVDCVTVSPCAAGVCPPGFACQLSCCGGTLCFPICA
jgi:hypothetical protein